MRHHPHDKQFLAYEKGKVERFNGYLKSSFVVPLAATLRQSGLKLDVVAANSYVGRWLEQVANVRVHGTTGERPIDRLAIERDHLLALPAGEQPAQVPQRPYRADLRRELSDERQTQSRSGKTEGRGDGNRLKR